MREWILLFIVNLIFSEDNEVMYIVEVVLVNINYALMIVY